MDFTAKIEQVLNRDEKLGSPKYSPGYEPLFVVEDYEDLLERTEFERNERLCRNASDEEDTETEQKIGISPKTCCEMNV